MDFNSFLEKYGSRINAYVSRFRKAWRLPTDFEDDLRQAAHIGAWGALPYWREGIGHKSAFNWCAGPMRRNMERALRSHHGYKPCGSEAIREVCSEYVEGEYQADMGLGAEETIDLKRILMADRKPAHVVRFIATALSPASGADIARASGISRQAVCISVRQTRKRLRMAMGF